MLGSADGATNAIPLLDPDGTDADNKILRSAIGTTTDPRNSNAAGYVYTTNNYALDLTIAENTITWDQVRMRKDQVFRTIVKLATSGTKDTSDEIADPDDQIASLGGAADIDRDVGDDGVYPFYTMLDGNSKNDAARELLADADDANLYAVRSQNDGVTFYVMDGAVPGTDGVIEANIGIEQDHVTYPAASPQTITFPV